MFELICSNFYLSFFLWWLIGFLLALFGIRTKRNGTTLSDILFAVPCGIIGLFAIIPFFIVNDIDFFNKRLF